MLKAADDGLGSLSIREVVESALEQEDIMPVVGTPPRSLNVQQGRTKDSWCLYSQPGPCLVRELVPAAGYCERRRCPKQLTHVPADLQEILTMFPTLLRLTELVR